MPRPPRWGAAAALALLVACGPGEPAPPEAAEPALATSVRQYSRALATRDAERTWAFVSADCKRRMDRTEHREVVRAGNPLGDPTADRIDVVVDGDDAVVSYSTATKVLAVSDQRWTREDGRWRWSDCSEPEPNGGSRPDPEGNRR